MVGTIEVSEGAQHKVKQASGTVGYACPECRGRGPFFFLAGKNNPLMFGGWKWLETC